MTDYTLDDKGMIRVDGQLHFDLTHLATRVIAALNACDGIDDATLSALPHGALCTAYEVCRDIHDGSAEP